jgi:UDP-galactopyranose mutase
MVDIVLSIGRCDRLAFNFPTPDNFWLIRGHWVSRFTGETEHWMYDWLVVGAGYSGAVMAERIATQLDQRVLVIDRRSHIAGNAHDYLNEQGVLVHGYGPHLFHTNSQRVWDYLSQFTTWRPYSHRARAIVDGREIPIPFNFQSLAMVFPESRAQKLQSRLIEKYGAGAEVPILKLRQETDPDLRELAEFIYNKIFHGYTVKQWALKPEQLAPSVTARVPVRLSTDDRYFQDRFQAMPAEGYTPMFQRMLTHRNIHVALGMDYRHLSASIRYKRMIFTGPIDAYFDFIHGELPYRSLRFEFQTLQQKQFQSVGTMNFPNDEKFTRITEFKILSGQTCPNTTIAREFSQAHVKGITEPFYPIPREENRAVFEKYHQEAKKLGGSVVFCGRLADYQYYNMDQVVARALVLFEQEVADATGLRSGRIAQPKIAAA